MARSATISAASSRTGATGPRNAEPTYEGLRDRQEWIDEDGDVAATTCSRSRPAAPSRAPAPYDATGLPLHLTNERRPSRERFHLDKNDPNILHDEITVFDHALTRPLERRQDLPAQPNPRPNWNLTSCTEGNNQIVIGTENYFLSGTDC